MLNSRFWSGSPGPKINVPPPHVWDPKNFFTPWLLYMMRCSTLIGRTETRHVPIILTTFMGGRQHSTRNEGSELHAERPWLVFSPQKHTPFQFWSFCRKRTILIRGDEAPLVSTTVDCKQCLFCLQPSLLRMQAKTWRGTNSALMWLRWALWITVRWVWKWTACFFFSGNFDQNKVINNSTREITRLKTLFFQKLKLWIKQSPMFCCVEV